MKKLNACLFNIKAKSVVLFAFFIPITICSQINNPLIDSSINSAILNLEFKDAKSILNKHLNTNSSLEHLVILNKVELIEILLTEDKVSFERAKDNRSNTLKSINNHSEVNEKNWASAELYLDWALLRMSFHEYVLAFWEFNKAKKCIENIDSNSFAFKKSKKAAGLIHSIISVIPEQYQWVSNSLGFKGDISQGLIELNLFLDNIPKNSFLHSDGKIALSIIQSYLNEDIPNGIKTLEELNNYLLIDYFQLLLFNRSGDHKRFNEKLKLLNKKSVENKIPFLYFINGMDHLYRFDTTGIKFFQKYIDNFKGSSYKAEAFQKMSWISLVNNDTSNYFKYTYLAKNTDESQTDVDLNAKKVSEKIPDITLLKARILFDGGYYNSSLELIKDKSTNEFTNTYDKTELVYRAARNFHKLNNVEKALTFYDHAISYGKNLDYYFKASAAYNMGKIYENLKEQDKAIQSYNQCLSFKNYPYKRSFDIKAKAGIQRLSK